MKKLILILFTIVLLTSCTERAGLKYPFIIKQTEINYSNNYIGTYKYTVKGINIWHEGYFYSDKKFNIGDTRQ
jgi:hypothetical protein